MVGHWMKTWIVSAKVAWASINRRRQFLMAFYRVLVRVLKSAHPFFTLFTNLNAKLCAVLINNFELNIICLIRPYDAKITDSRSRTLGHIQSIDNQSSFGNRRINQHTNVHEKRGFQRWQNYAATITKVFSVFILLRDVKSL